MDIKETGKKLKPFAPVLSVALVTACVAGSLSGYEAPVYAATQEETPIKEDTAIVIVDIGPASDIGIFKLSANKVGSQFFVAHPGRLGAAK